MKEILYLLLIPILISCNEHEIIQVSKAEKYQQILDTLDKYDDYILGDYNGDFLLSTDVTLKKFSANTDTFSLDSSYLDFRIGYKLLENPKKITFLAFWLMESNTKLDSENNNRYKYFSDFVKFFNRNTFEYYNRNQPIDNIHNVYINYQDFQDLEDNLFGYHSSDFKYGISPENFNFIIDNINVIEHPLKKVEIYYSFKFIGVNYNDDESIVKNGKGKSTFEYN